MKHLYFLLFALFTTFIAKAIEPITGTTTICLGDNTTLSDATAGGVWSCTPGNATIDASTGVLSSIAAGTTTVSYSIGSNYQLTVVTINPLPDAGTITGPASLCPGEVITISSTSADGVWSTTNSSASVAGGSVTGITAGVDTIVYTVTNSCGTATALYAVTVNPLPDAGIISGPATVCVGSTITLASTIAGGTWDIANANASISAGSVTGVSAGADTVTYTISNTCGTAIATFEVTVNPLPEAGTISGTATVCVAADITLTASASGGVWSAANSNANVTAGTVTGVTEGLDTISYSVTNSCGTAVALFAVTVNPLPDATITSGSLAICEGASTVITTTVSGGTWTASNGNATITAGSLTGISAGLDTITYTVNNSCGTDVATIEVTVNTIPDAGTISGAHSVCEAATITLTNTATGGSWSVTNGNASVSAGTVTGINAGVDTVLYTVGNVCGAASATYEVSVNPLPVAGTISGPAIVCEGTTITLSNTAPDGVWSISNGNATISSNIAGIDVTGITLGLDTVLYIVTNTCGNAVATYAVTVSAVPVAAGLTGPSVVCQGASILLSDAVPGGTWSADNGNVTVTGGNVIGVAEGTSTVSYNLTNTCGTDVATRIITINPLPITGTISGPMYVCPGGTITLTSSISGGFWHASNPNAMISSAGVVTGITAGAVVMSYSFINSCGTASAIAVVIVNPLPDAGTIGGSATVCEAATTVLSPSVTGGTWSVANANASVTAGIVTGIAAGTDIVTYTVINSCGTASATHAITIDPLPVAGTIGGASAVCATATTLLLPTSPGGTWSTSNANAVMAGNAVTGITAGTDVLTYTVTTACGAASVTRVMSINPLPVAGNITGVDIVCEAAQITLTDAAAGGVWTASNANATVAAGIVSGVSAGTVTISYTVTNLCGVAGTAHDVTVNPLPVTGTITGPGNVCPGAAITLAATATGGTWSASNAHATISGGILEAASAGTVTISYTVGNSCGTAAAIKVVTVDPLPNAGTIAGMATVCIGDSIVLSATSPGGVWSHDNANATVAAGVVKGIAAGNVTISYRVTNSCGTDVTSQLIVVQSCVAGVADVNGDNELQVFPNPAADELNIAAAANTYSALVITNSAGQVILSQAFTTTTTKVNIASLAAGMYYIRLSGDGGSVVRKFVKL